MKRMKQNIEKLLQKALNLKGLSLILLFMFIGCAGQALVTTYYLLDYYPTTTSLKLLRENPLPYRVQVMNFKIPRSFDSIRIIARFSSHQINYYRYSLWAVRPQVAATDLLIQHINAYQLFQACQREYLTERPDYEITGEIFQIEKFESEGYSAAHLKAAFEMVDREKNETIIRYEFDRETKVPEQDMAIFAKALSDIIQSETELFLEEVVDYFYPPETDSLNIGK